MSVVSNQLISDTLNWINSQVEYIGIGTGETPLTTSSILLDNEENRKVVTKSIDGDTLIVEGYWDETEANGVTFTETGIFDNTATGTLDTGKLYSGGQINVPKDSTQTLTVSIEIQIEGVEG